MTPNRSKWLPPKENPQPFANLTPASSVPSSSMYRPSRYHLHSPSSDELTGHACHYCGCSLVYYSDSDVQHGGMRGIVSGYGWYVEDHVIPKKYGGQNNEGNLIPACHKCNNTKRAKSYMEFVMDYEQTEHRLNILAQGISPFSAQQLLDMIAFELTRDAKPKTILERVELLASVKRVE